MATTSQIISFLQRQGPALFQSNADHLTELELTIASTPFEGLALAAPSQLSLKNHSLPIVLVSQRTVMRGWEVRESENLWLVFSEVSSGKVAIKLLAKGMPAEKYRQATSPPRSPKPTEDEGNGIETQVRLIEGLELYDSALNDGPLTITALCFDWSSNSAQVEIFGAGAAAVLPTTVTDNSLPVSFVKPDKTISLNKPGLEFDLDQSRLQPNQVFISGQFLKAAKAFESIPDYTIPMKGKRLVTVVPITFVLLGLNRRVPYQTTINVPIYAQENILPSGEIAGHFQLNILEKDYPELSAGSYVLYAFMEGKAYGPQKFELK